MQNTSRSDELEKRFPGLIPAILNAHKAQAVSKTRASSARSKKSARSAARSRGVS
ncbi:MAG: hypothetical protein QOK23_2901 [Gammaproteobacteria bacterium]|jgi:hypothetical protein|nr:hypothetical protein [Gammaproteobacteria bacterium]MEA3140732.1 hypothetical protein [Gammaproteobacteria bacterium]